MRAPTLIPWLSSVAGWCCLFSLFFLILRHLNNSLYSVLWQGMINIPAVALGMFSGGVVMKKYKLGIMGAAKFAFGTSLLGYFLSLFFLAMGCENSKVAGITVSYNGWVMSRYIFHMSYWIMSNIPFLFHQFFIWAVNNTFIFFMSSHAERKAFLLRNRLSSLTVIPVACAPEGSGIRFVERMGSPTCLPAWLDAPPLPAPAETRSDIYHWLQDTLICSYNSRLTNRKHMVLITLFYSYYMQLRCICLTFYQHDVFPAVCQCIIDNIFFSFFC